MPLSVHWFLPTDGDSRDVVGFGPRPAAAGRPRLPRPGRPGGRAARLRRRAHADRRLVRGRLADHRRADPETTERLKFLVAFRPGLVSPTLAAQMAATFQRLSRRPAAAQRRHRRREPRAAPFGDFLDKDAATPAPTSSCRSCARAGRREVDFDGEHHRVEGATVAHVPTPCRRLLRRLVRRRHGSPRPHADVYLTWGEPPAVAAERSPRIRELWPPRGADDRFGIRLHVITRDTADEAWAEADRLLDGIDPADRRVRSRQGLARSESEGQRRMLALHGGRRDDLEIPPNLWAGIGLVRGGAGTALVGSHEEVADRIEEYHAVGIDEFILSGYPHLEEAYWFGEGVRRDCGKRALADPRRCGRSDRGRDRRPGPCPALLACAS